MKPQLVTLIGLALACLALAGFALRGPQEAASRASEVVTAGGHYLLSGAASQPEATTLKGGRYRPGSSSPNAFQLESRQDVNPASTSGKLFSTTDPSPSATTLRGGHYQLTNVSSDLIQAILWQESDLTSGGGYHLLTLANPQLTGDGCCCMYLPCVQR